MVFLMFSIYINDFPQSLSKSGSVCKIKTDIYNIEDARNKEFSALSEWFMDLEELIHFGGDKTDCILFSIPKSFSKLNISNANNNNDNSNNNNNNNNNNSNNIMIISVDGHEIPGGNWHGIFSPLAVRLKCT